MESCISLAFPNISLFQILSTYQTPNYNWTVFKEGTRQYVLRKPTTEYGSKQLIKEIKAYTSTSFDSKKASLCNFFSQILKYAISKDGTKIETIEKFDGVPIYSLPQYIENQEPRYIIQHLELLLRNVAILLSSNGIVHGNLSTENILFNRSNHMVKIIGGNYARYADEITEELPYSTCSSPFYCLSNSNFNGEEAINEDMKAIALILYDISLRADDKEKLSLEHECFKNKKMKLNFYKICSLIDEKKLLLHQHSLKQVLDKMLLSSDDISYSDILKIYPGDIIPYLEIMNASTVKIEHEIQESDENEEQKQSKIFSCYNSKMKVKKIGHNCSYFVEVSEYGQFFIKVYQNQEEYDREKSMCILGAKQNLTTFPSLNDKIPVQNLELAFEYVGQDIVSKVQFNIEDRSILSNVMAAIYHITDNFSKGKVFNFSICPSHIAIENNWVPKIVNFKNSLVYAAVDISQSLKISESIDIDYASPELLKILLTGNHYGEICPDQSMMYSTAKSIVAALMKCCDRIDILNKMYGMTVTSEEKITEEVIKMLDDKDKEFLKSTGKETLESVALALFYIRNNDLLVKSVLAMKRINYRTNPQYHSDCMNNLSIMLSADYKQRHSIQKALEIAEPPENNNTGTIKITDIRENNTIIDNAPTIPITERPPRKDCQQNPETESMIATRYLCPKPIRPSNILSPSQEQNSQSDKLLELFKNTNPDYSIIETMFWSSYLTKTSSFASLTKENQIRSAQLLKGIYIPIFQMHSNTITAIKLKRGSKNSDIFEKSGETVPVEHTISSKFAQCIIDNSPYPKLLMIGGLIGGVSQKSLYKITAKKRSQLADMSIGRDQFGMASLPNFVAVAGGKCAYSKDNYKVLDTVELYDAKVNIWTKAEGRMKESRLLPSIILNSGKLYVIGGLSSKQQSSTSNYSSSIIDVFTITDYSVKYEKTLKINDDSFNETDSAYMIISASKILLISNFFIQQNKLTYISKKTLQIDDDKASTIEKSDSHFVHGAEPTDCKCAVFREGCLFFPQFLNKEIDHLELTLNAVI